MSSQEISKGMSNPHVIGIVKSAARNMGNCMSVSEFAIVKYTWFMRMKSEGIRYEVAKKAIEVAHEKAMQRIERRNERIANGEDVAWI